MEITIDNYDIMQDIIIDDIKNVNILCPNL